MDNERKQTDEAKRGREESQAHIELLQRRLEAEQARRTAAEQKLEQSAPADNPPPATNVPALRSRLDMPRLGRYQELAAVLGYDPASDRLFALMHEEVRVTAAYADWQATHMERVTARRRDLDQSHDEQSVAAVLAARWHMIDHPHVRLGAVPQWQLTGCLLDAKSEHYLRTITHERIGGMSGRLGRG